MKKFNVNISFINPDYDAEYEKQYGFLERQYENPKFGNEISWRFENLTQYLFKEKTDFEVEYFGHNEKKKCLLKNVCVLEILKEEKIIAEFVVSKSLISSTRKISREKHDKGYFYFYLKPNIKYERLADHIYITAKEIPEELKLKEL